MILEILALTLDDLSNLEYLWDLGLGEQSSYSLSILNSCPCSDHLLFSIFVVDIDIDDILGLVDDDQVPPLAKGTTEAQVFELLVVQDTEARVSRLHAAEASEVPLKADPKRPSGTTPIPPTLSNPITHQEVAEGAEGQEVEGDKGEFGTETQGFEFKHRETKTHHSTEKTTKRKKKKPSEGIGETSCKLFDLLAHLLYSIVILYCH
ncbi:hypothetical protein NE237_025694 [Protea cynaroides]|uniref:Uncharacterized protein n=1 Tax=Protea cynaroides TaxID=273540 RepID=A0A9Q0H5C5_9MAGN|nr:hypothetical protein NE237_025694 [Protea cynaroides]